MRETRLIALLPPLLLIVHLQRHSVDKRADNEFSGELEGIGFKFDITFRDSNSSLIVNILPISLNNYEIGKYMLSEHDGKMFPTVYHILIRGSILFHLNQTGLNVAVCT